MSCTFPGDLIEKTIAFHGHSCPGLAIGIRAAEYARREFSGTDPADLVCVTETDMCGVDGIQFLTGCTFGKGNLIHRDYGKAAFSFFDKTVERGIRLVFHATAADEGREEMKKRIMESDLEDLFTKQVIEQGPPRAARVLDGLTCEECGERTMESRTRRFSGKTLCIPCFGRVEQKV